MSYYELTKQAGELRKAKKYEEALPLYKEVLDDYPDECGDYDWWGYSQCLLKLDIYEESLKFSREGLIKFPESIYLKNVYTWSLYHARIKPEPVTDRDRFFKSANAIVKLCAVDDKYSPLAITVFKVIDLLELDYDQNVNEILAWIAKLDPEKLSRDTFPFTSQEGKEMEMASDFEKYYTILIKAQQETGRYDECIANANLAFREIEHFHYGQEVWTRRQRALAYYKTGKFTESLADFKQVLMRKQDWFLKMELALLYLAMGDRGNALISALDAADDPGVSEMKVNLFLLIAKLFLEAGKQDEAALHARLVVSLRTREGWSHNDDATEILASATSAAEFPEDFNALLKLAQKVWAANQPEVARLRGVISRMLPHGNAGFIKGDDGTDCYFQVRDISDRNLHPAKDIRVNYIKTESFDRLKNAPSHKATDIKRG